MPTNLAPVYLDDARVQLQGDPRPRVSKIVAAGGKAVGDDLVVMRLRGQDDTKGSPIQLEDVIDRSGQTEPVYLRSAPSAAEARSPADESSREEGSQLQFGAARRGIAGQGAKDSPGDVPAHKQAKSDAPTATDLGSRPSRGNPDSTQEFQSGGRQGEGLPASHPSQQGQRRSPSREGDGPGTSGDAD